MAATHAVVDPDETWHLPSQVYLAVRPDDQGRGPVLETREVAGQQAVLAYSSLEEFLAGCGPAQPWMLVPANRLMDMAGGASDLLGGSSVRFGVAIDPSIPEELRGAAGSMLGEEAQLELQPM